MTALKSLICALCLLPLAQVAAAQSGDQVDRADLAALDRMGMEVGTYAAEYLGGYGDLFEPQMLVKLGVIAKQRAIAHTCDGFEVDMERYNTAMDGLLRPIIDMIKPPEDGGAAINLPFTIAMSAYSMLLGGNIASGAAAPDKMCALGSDLRDALAGGDDEALLIWTTAD